MTKKIVISLAVDRRASALGVLYGKGLLSVHQGFQPPASLSVLRWKRRPKPRPPRTLSPMRRAAAMRWTRFQGPLCAVQSLGHLVRALRLPNCRPGPAGQVRAGAESAGGGRGHDKGRGGRAFLKSHNAGCAGHLVDTDTGAMMRGFGAYGLPTTVLIDPEGQDHRPRRRARRMGIAESPSPISSGYWS